MKEFYWWVLIVTFLLFLLAFSIGLSWHADKQVRKAEVILQRAEQLEKEKKREKPRTDPVDAD